MEYYVFCIILLGIVFYGISFQRENENQIELLNRFNNLRGVFAIMIIIGHCSMRFEKEVLPLMLIHKFNMVGVCFFLFISGWGLSYSYLEQGKELRGFVKRKIAYLFIASVISSIVYFGLNEVALKGSRDLVSIFIFILKNTNWYIWESCFFYAVFYICAKSKRKNMLLLIHYIAALVICVLALNLHWDRAFYFSAFCFPTGILLNRYWYKIQLKLENYKYLPLVVFFVGGISALSVATPQDSFFGGVLLRNCFGIMSMAILFIIMRYVRIDNFILRFLKRISLELYLYQFAVMTAVKLIYENLGLDVDLSYVILVIGALMISCYFISKLDTVIKQRLH